MHNTHYIIVSAENKDDAITQVEDVLDNFGDENNWYNIENTYELENLEVKEIKIINEHLKDLNAEISPYKINKVNEQIESLQQQLSSGNRYLYWQISELYRDLYEMTGVGGKYTINNIISGETNNYNGYKYDEYGITNLATDEYNTDKTYFVVIDMHS